MKAHTQTFKENLIKLGKEIDAKVTYTIDGVTTELDGDTLSSVTPHYEGAILKSVMKQVDITSDVDIPLETIVNVQFGMKYDDEEYEYINYGNYIIKESKYQEDTKKYILTCYDKMLYTMKNYEALEITYPITIRDYINAICTKTGLTFANVNDTFANYNQTIESELYDNNYTYRDVLDELAQVTASTICINDNDELEIRYIDDAVSESEQVDGTDFTLTSEKAKLSGLELEGQTTQETTNGYNIYADTNNLYNKVTDAGQFTKANESDGGLRLTKTTSGTTSPRFAISLTDEGTYTFSCKVKGTAPKVIVGTILNNTWTEKANLIPTTNNYQILTFTFNYTSGSNPRIFFRNNNDTTFPLNTYLIINDFMIEKGSTRHDYEPYTNGPSPNPEYPQAINTITGLQEIEIVGKNLFPYSNMTNQYTYIMPCSVGDTYTLSFKGSATSNQRVFLRTYDGNNAPTSTMVDNVVTYVTTTPTDYTATITSTINGYLYVVTSVAPTAYTLENIQLEKGNVTTNYEPYKIKKHELNLGKNLFDIETISSSNRQYKRNNGFILTKGTNRTIQFNLPNSIPAGTYTLSVKVVNSTLSSNSKFMVNFNGSGSTILGNVDILNNSTFTITSPVDNVYFFIASNESDGVTITIDDIMLEKGDKATSFSPYFTPIELGEINNYKDFIRKGTGKNLFDKDSVILGKVWNGASNTKRAYGYIEAIQGQQYTISTKNSNSDLKIYLAETSSVGSGTNPIRQVEITSSTSNTFIPNASTNYIVVQYSTTTNDITQAMIDNSLVQIEEGIQTLYEPYGYKDKWYLYKTIGKVVLNGSESWQLRNTSTNGTKTYSLQNVPSDYLLKNTWSTGEKYAYCDKFKVNHTVYGAADMWGNLLDVIGISFYYSSGTSRYMYINTTENLPTYLSSNNAILYYVLATPTTIEITNANYPELYSQLKAIDKAQTFEGTTNISSSLPITFSYISELETIDEDYIKNTRASFGEKYGPINSIVLSRSAESDNIYIQDEESIEENGLCEIKIKDNQIMNDNTRDRFLPDLLERLDGLEYYINDFESIGVTYLDLCDRYKIKIDDNNYYCIMFNDEVGIHDGLNEIIYTDMPKETITDYTKADKTDRRINQTYLIVDKQNQRIDAVVSTQEEFEESLSSLTIDVDGIRSKVELNYDFVRETSGNNYVSVDDIQQEGLLELIITGTAISESYLRLHITNNDPEYVDLPITTILKQNDDVYDTLSLEAIYNEETELYELHCFIDKKLDYINNQIVTHSSGNNYLLASDSNSLRTENGEELLLEDYVEGKEDLGIINIPIQQGEHTFSLDGFTGLNYYLKYAVLNNITSEFALKKHIVSEINQSPEQISISAEKIKLEGYTTINEGFSVDLNGNMTCRNANINGDYLSLNGTDEEDNPVFSITSDGGYFGAGEYGIFMLSKDYKSIINISNYNEGPYSYGEISLGTQIEYEDGGVYFQEGVEIRQVNNYGIIALRNGENGITTITLEGSDGNITCVSLTQTSKEENKKNFELLKNALEIVKDTDIYKYNFNFEEDKDKKHIGFVIGDSFKYRSEITSKQNEGADIYAMISVLWKAVQEQQEQIEKMQKEIDILKGGK